MYHKEYEKNVLVTESKDILSIKNRVDDKMIRLLHASLGMSSELAELVDAIVDPKGGNIDWVNVMEESGDLTWYLAVAVNALGLDPAITSSCEEAAREYAKISPLTLPRLSKTGALSAIDTTVWAVGNYSDLLKKALFYGKELDMVAMETTVKQIALGIVGICHVSSYSIEDARETNIKKLRARYGEKFTEAAAIERNLEKERSVLEEKND